MLGDNVAHFGLSSQSTVQYTLHCVYHLEIDSVFCIADFCCAVSVQMLYLLKFMVLFFFFPTQVYIYSVPLMDGRWLGGFLSFLLHQEKVSFLTQRAQRSEV